MKLKSTLIATAALAALVSPSFAADCCSGKAPAPAVKSGKAPVKVVASVQPTQVQPEKPKSFFGRLFSRDRAPKAAAQPQPAAQPQVRVQPAPRPRRAPTTCAQTDVGCHCQDVCTVKCRPDSCRCGVRKCRDFCRKGKCACPPVDPHPCKCSGLVDQEKLPVEGKADCGQGCGAPPKPAQILYRWG